MPDLEVPTSVLDAQPTGRTLLVLGAKSAGKRDLVAVDVEEGTIRWRTQLEKWGGTALFTVGPWAMTADDRGTLTALDAAMNDGTLHHWPRSNHGIVC